MADSRYLYLNASGTEKIRIGNGKVIKHIANRKKIEQYISQLHLLPNPDKVLRKLDKRITVYRDMLYDHMIQRCVNVRVAGLKKREFTVEENDAEKVHIEYVEALFERLNMSMLLEHILNARWWGYQPFELELVQNAPGALIELINVVDKPAEWFAFSPEHKLKLLSTPKGELLPEENFIVAVNRPTSENPYGWAEFAPVFWHTQFSKGGLKLFLAFVEKYGSPFLFGTYGEDATEEQKTDLFNTLVDMVQDAVGIGPEGSALQIIESASKGASADVFEKLIKICDKAKLINLVGQTLTTDIGDSGSRAASETHLKVENEITEGDVEFAEEFLLNLVKRMLDLNWPGIKQYPVPRLVLKKEEDPDKLMERDLKAQKLGVTWKKERFTDAHHIPEEHFELNEKTENPREDKSEFSERGSGLSHDELLNSFSPEDYNAQVENIIEPILELIKESENLKEAQEKLSLIYPQMNGEKLEAVLTHLIFIAKITGAQHD